MVILFPHEEREVHRLVTFLREGRLVFMPFDSIWGIACRISARNAIERIYQIKGRESQKPFIVGVSSLSMLEAYTGKLPEPVRKEMLERARPVTVIFSGVKGIPPWIRARDGTVAFRIIRMIFASSVISALQEPVVTTSLNRSGEPPARTPQDAPPDLLRQMDAVAELSFPQFRSERPSRILRWNAKNQTWTVIRP